MKPPETFRKEERLCSLKTISLLFEKGNVFHTSLFKVIWLESPAEIIFPAQVLFSVSKRNMRLAVTRNLAKRRMREVYRKNKHMLYDHLETSGRQLVIAFILKLNEVPPYHEIERSMSEVISRLIRSINQKTAGQTK